MLRVSLLVAVLASSAQAFSYAPSLTLRPSMAQRAPRSGIMPLKMQESENSENSESSGPAVPVPVARKPDPRATSFFSRNLSEEKKTSKTYYNTEDAGEFLSGPDRADEWGEELTEMGKWQRTMGPIYVQGAGGALVVLGFVNYFALSNMGGASSTVWLLGILTALLGFALQRKTD